MQSRIKHLNTRGGKGGFVVLFAVILTTIILAIALGLADVSFREIVLVTSGEESDKAFYAADTGAECALFYDLQNPKSLFGVNPNDPNSFISVAVPNCAGTAVDLYQGTATGPWVLYLPNLGSDGRSCAKVTVTKTFDPDTTSVISEGYNIGSGTDCTSFDIRRVERRLELNY